MGAPDPRKDGRGKKSKLSGLTDKARSHWAYQPLARSRFPHQKHAVAPDAGRPVHFREARGERDVPGARRDARKRCSAARLTI